GTAGTFFASNHLRRDRMQQRDRGAVRRTRSSIMSPLFRHTTLAAGLALAALFATPAVAPAQRVIQVPVPNAPTPPWRDPGNYHIAPGLTMTQYAYTLPPLGRAYQQVPPWAYGYNPYPSPVYNYRPQITPPYPGYYPPTYPYGGYPT